MSVCGVPALPTELSVPPHFWSTQHDSVAAAFSQKNEEAGDLKNVEKTSQQTKQNKKEMALVWLCLKKPQDAKLKTCVFHRFLY